MRMEKRSCWSVRFYFSIAEEKSDSTSAIECECFERFMESLPPKIPPISIIAIAKHIITTSIIFFNDDIVRTDNHSICIDENVVCINEYIAIIPSSSIFRHKNTSLIFLYDKICLPKCNVWTYLLNLLKLIRVTIINDEMEKSLRWKNSPKDSDRYWIYFEAMIFPWNFRFLGPSNSQK